MLPQTQAELDAIIERRIGRERKRMQHRHEHEIEKMRNAHAEIVSGLRLEIIRLQRGRGWFARLFSEIGEKNQHDGVPHADHAASE